MRNSMSRISPNARISLMAIMGLIMALAIAGCGGGGGGAPIINPPPGNNPPPGQNPTLAFISGLVVDNSFPPKAVSNALVSVLGTGITARTASNGTFTLPNVPLSATQFSVASPDPNLYYNIAKYNSKQYDTILCPMPLPTLTAGANTLPGGAVALYAGGFNPPPAPIIGCPP